MTDALLLRWLARLGMDDLSYRVLPALPLMPVAWADGAVQRAEEQVLRDFAARFSPGPEAWLLLEDWLVHPPSESYVRGGHAALGSLAGRRGAHLSLPAGVADAVRAAARQVARAHGGFLGIGSVSRAETRALRLLDELLATPPPMDADSLRQRHVTLPLEGRAGAALVAGDEVLPIEQERSMPATSPGQAPRVSREGRLWLLHAGDTTVLVDGERVRRRRLLGGEAVQVGDRHFTFCLVRRQPQTVTG